MNIKGTKLSEETNIIDFRAKTSPAGEEPTNDWLKDLKAGTIIACRPRVNSASLEQSMASLKQPFVAIYGIEMQTEKLAKLQDHYSEPGSVRLFWADTKRFSNLYELVEIIHDDSNRPVQPE